MEPPPPPDSWETADLDEPMSRLLLSSTRRVSSSPDLSDRDSPPPSDSVDQLDQFLREALEKPRERLSVLRMEQDILKFIHDPRQTQFEFLGLPTSYLRLAAHRLAQHYFLQSIALPDNGLPDGSGSRIILRKTSSECKLPSVRLSDIPVNLPQEESNSIAKVAIKQRPQKHYHSNSGAGAHTSRANLQKSVEERKEEYNKARARIFSNSSSSGNADDGRSVDEVTLPPNTLHRSTSLELNSGSRLGEGPEITLERSLTTSSSSRSNRNKTEKDPAVNRNRQNNRVAIFRDRESDRKDPDYNRSYDRYMQRFDPGFGFNGGSYTIQPLYAPAVNYNTEFPQLGSHGSPVPVEQHPQTITQHIPGPWSPSQSPNAIGYRPPDGAMPPPYSPGHAGVQIRSSVFMHTPQQYAMPSRPGVTFVHLQEPMRPFAQTHQQQSEANLHLARPR
ncbi:hypothetical protein ABZP36_035064 [Zizania latifolia]